MAKIDLASNSALLSVAERLDTQNALLATMADINGALPITDWSTVQGIVRMGLAPKIFSIGDSFTCEHEEFGTLTWDIVGIDQDTPANKAKKHSLTLMLRTPCVSLPFSGPEALLFCGGELTPGTYYFTIPKSSNTSAKSYYFTTTQSHYSPNVIFFNSSTKKVVIYSDPTLSTVLETLSASTGTSGTFLGTADGSYLNYGQRIMYGNETWKSSDIRQWLGSDKAVWQEYSEDKGVLNMPSSYASRAGFLHKIDPEFAAVLGKVVKKTKCNQALGGYLVETEDAVFLPALSELYCSLDKNGDEGAAYSYFADYSDHTDPSDNSDANRIKTGIRNDYNEHYMLRSAWTDGDTGMLWRINSEGGANSRGGASTSANVVPMCCIV